VLEVIQRSATFLGKRGVDSPRLQIELLLAHVLSLPRLNLYLDFDRVLTGSQLDSVRELVRRRGEREPLQHLVGSTPFCGLEIRVNRHVLVPRPETELLAERAWEFLGGLSSSGPKAFDFGTGSGCVAIAMAVRCPAAEIYAVDISPDALVVARENARSRGVADRIRFDLGDGFASLPPGLAFDLIVANPPYIPGGEIDTLAPEVRDHDPREALDGGPDGLRFFRRLAAESAERLRPAGMILMEFGDGQAEEIGSIFQQNNWVVENVEPDYSGRPRIFSARPVRV